MSPLGYFWFVFMKFSHYCSSYPRLDSTKVKNKTHYGIFFSTRAFPFLSQWYDIFYDSKVIKKVPLNLYDLLTYEALAHWIMGDGNKLGTGIILNTQSFTLYDCVRIVSVLSYKFEIICNIYSQRNKPIIYITGKSMRKLNPYISLYFVPSMLYKLHTWKYKTKT